MEPRKVGRPPKSDPTFVNECILKRKAEVIFKNKIVGKANDVWKRLAEDTGELASGLYSRVMDNRCGIRELLGMDLTAKKRPSYDFNESKEEHNSSISSNNGIRELNVFYSKAEFDNLLLYTEYNRKDTRKRKRRCAVLKPGEWQQSIVEKLWQKYRVSCGYNFKNHHININAGTGSVLGQCACTSTINGIISDIGKEIVTITCSLTKGNGKCCKRPCRAPERERIGKQMQEKRIPASKYRVDQAKQIMTSEDNSEPSFMYSGTVLREVKREYINSMHLHPDPIQSLILLSGEHGKLRGKIRKICSKPFYVLYWTNDELHRYQSQKKKHEFTSVAIDASGGFVPKISYIDGTRSSVIFLYQCIVQSIDGETEENTFPACHMLSSSHKVNTILDWLREWISSGAPPPDEVVTDYSKALLIAAITAFTKYDSITEYVNACFEWTNNPQSADNPRCYVRLDVAHYIVNWSRSLSAINNKMLPNVKKLYLMGLGVLIKTRSFESFANILKSLLIISQSEKDGNVISTGEETACKKHKWKLREILRDEWFEEDAKTDDESLIIEERDDEEDAPTGNNEKIVNKCYQWAQNINDEVQKECHLDDDTDNDNAHFCPEFARRLLEECKRLPLWSCVSRDTFGYGRVPASSASAESQFNIAKNIIFSQVHLPIRVDDFLSLHVDFLDGRFILLNVNDKKSAIDENNTTHENSIETLDDVEGKKCVFCCELGKIKSADRSADENFLCLGCRDLPGEAVQHILSSREIEDWRGLASKDQVPHKKKKKSLYLDKGFVDKDFIVHETLTKLPIMKNANSWGSRPVTINKVMVTLSNTCAFDSLLQILLAGTFDSINFHEALDDMDLPFANLVSSICTKGLTAVSYRERGIILSGIREPKSGPNNSASLNCGWNVGSLFMRLFEKHPSFSRTTSCTKGCKNITQTWTILDLMSSDLDKQTLDMAIQEIIMRPKNKNCEACGDSRETIIINGGKILAIEIVSLDASWKIQNTSIPQEILISDRNIGHKYKLLGLVDFRPFLTTRHSKGKMADERSKNVGFEAVDVDGHYVALSLRKNKQWVEYDDLRDKCKIIRSSVETVPHLILYSKYE